MPYIFISYRRNKNNDSVLVKQLHQYILDYPSEERLTDGVHLVESFKEDDVFFDKNDRSILPGQEWWEEIKKSIISSTFFIVLIDSEWADEWKPRTETDYVLEEIKIALNTDKIVVPVVVHKTGENSDVADAMGVLPPEITELAKRQAETISYEQQGNDYRLDKEAVYDLLDKLRVLKVYEAIRYGIRSAFSQSLGKLRLENDKAIKDLLDSLYATRAVQNDTISLKYLDKSMLQVDRDLLVKVIRVIGLKRRLYDDTGTHADYIDRQLRNIFEMACRELAMADRRARRIFSENKTLMEDERYAGIYYGYLTLLTLPQMIDESESIVAAANTSSEISVSDYLEDIRAEAIAYYREYNQPPGLGGRKDMLNQRFKLQTAPGYQDSLQFGYKMFEHTWKEFVSAEVIGAFVMAIIFSVGLANHNLLSEHFVTLRTSLPFTEDFRPGSCWLGGSCLWGTAYDLLSFAVMGGVGYLGLQIVRRERRGCRFTVMTGAILAGLLASQIGLFTFANQLVSADLMTVANFFLMFITEFLVMGVLTIPVMVLFLGIIGLASVLKNERRTRLKPDVNEWLAGFATITGMALVLFLFAAVVEKSRPDAPLLLVIGVFWGFFMVVGLLAGYKSQPEPDLSGKKQPDIWQKLRRPAWMVAASCLFAFILFVSGWWPNQVEFLTLPALAENDLTDAVADIQSQIENVNFSIELVRSLSVGAWFALAFYVGVEMLSHKMKNTGDVDVMRKNK